MDRHPDRRLLLTAILAQPAIGALFAAKAAAVDGGAAAEVPTPRHRERLRTLEADYFEQCWG